MHASFDGCFFGQGLHSMIQGVNMDWLDTLKFDDNGLMPAVAQDFHTGRILMMAWMNRESLRLTAEKMQAVLVTLSR